MSQKLTKLREENAALKGKLKKLNVLLQNKKGNIIIVWIAKPVTTKNYSVWIRILMLNIENTKTESYVYFNPCSHCFLHYSEAKTLASCSHVSHRFCVVKVNVPVCVVVKGHNSYHNNLCQVKICPLTTPPTGACLPHKSGWHATRGSKQGLRSAGNGPPIQLYSPLITQQFVHIVLHRYWWYIRCNQALRRKGWWASFVSCKYCREWGTDSWECCPKKGMVISLMSLVDIYRIITAWISSYGLSC